MRHFLSDHWFAILTIAIVLAVVFLIPLIFVYRSRDEFTQGFRS